MLNSSQWRAGEHDLRQVHYHYQYDDAHLHGTTFSENSRRTTSPTTPRTENHVLGVQSTGTITEIYSEQICALLGGVRNCRISFDTKRGASWMPTGDDGASHSAPPTRAPLRTRETHVTSSPRPRKANASCTSETAVTTEETSTRTSNSA